MKALKPSVKQLALRRLSKITDTTKMVARVKGLDVSPITEAVQQVKAALNSMPVKGEEESDLL